LALSHATHKHPNEISGGMKQRVGIARALAMEPKVLLLDEPFGALDALTRAGLQDELMRIVKETHATTLMVTHDVDEAVLLSDRIVMMTNGPAATIGEILEVGLPRPRDRLKLAENPAYHHLRGQVLEFLYQKHHEEGGLSRGEGKPAGFTILGYGDQVKSRFFRPVLAYKMRSFRLSVSPAFFASSPCKSDPSSSRTT
jgi:ABC-type sulfate/molybdate transport systems ATPase subunit